MADDFEDFNEDGWDYEITPEMEAEIKIAEQECNMGLTYTMIEIDGKHGLRCDQCQREAWMFERPFPHKLDCPMRR